MTEEENSLTCYSCDRPISFNLTKSGDKKRFEYFPIADNGLKMLRHRCGYTYEMFALEYEHLIYVNYVPMKNIW